MKLSLPLQTALFDHLKADAGISAALGGPKIHDAPPHAESGEAPPYITLGDEVITAWSTKTEEGAAHDLTFTIWSAARGYAEIKTAMAALHEALDGASLVLPGGVLVDVRFVSAETARTRSRLRKANCVFRALVEMAEAA